MFNRLSYTVKLSRNRGINLLALIALLASFFTALDIPTPAHAAIVPNAVVNLDGTDPTSLPTGTPTTWTSIGSSTVSGTITGATRQTDAQGGILSDGLSDGVYYAAGEGRTSGDMTAEMWIKPGNLKTGWNVIASRWFTSTGNVASTTADWHLAIYSDGTTAKLRMDNQTNNAGGGLSSTTTFPITSANKWYQVGFTISSTGTVRLFINGVYTGTTGTGSHTDSADALLIIGDTRPDSNNVGFGMVGRISKFRLYDTELSSAQLSQNFLSDSEFYGIAPVNTVAPTLSGSPKVGKTLYVSNGTWGAGDNSGSTTGYKWQSSTNGTTWTDIASATNANYVLTASEVGKYVRAVVTKTNSAGSTSANSPSSVAILPASSITVASGGKLTGLTSSVPNDATTYNVTLASSNLASTMLLGTTSGLTFVGGYASTASYMATSLTNAAPIVTFRGTGTAINTALADITYTSTAGNTDTVKLYWATAGTTTTDTKNYIPIYDNSQLTFHYYTYKYHTAALTRAGMDTMIAGLGTTDSVVNTNPWYLITMRYATEWTRMKNIIGTTNGVYMGSKADLGSYSWYWPANTDGYTSATTYATGTGPGAVTATSSIYNGTDTTLPYASGEPNGNSSEARSGYTYVPGGTTTPIWDDVPASCSCTTNFVMETYSNTTLNTGVAGSFAQSVHVATLSTAPTALTSTSIIGDSAPIYWTAPTTPGTDPIVDYQIEYSSNSGVTWYQWDHPASVDTSAKVTGLIPGTSYSFRVAAITTGLGAYSAVTTPTVAATAITVVATGGGVAGVDYSVNGSYLSAKSSTSVSINASDIQNLLLTQNVILAAEDIVVNAPITWATSQTLTLANPAYSSVKLNSSLSASGTTAGIVIRPTTYTLNIKAGASIALTGTSPSLTIGGNAYTLIKSTANLSTVATTGYYALAQPISYGASATTISASPISGTFTGTFDGLGNNIDRLNLSVTTSSSYGLFSKIGGTSFIRNLGVTTGTIKMGPLAGIYSVGLLAGGSEGTPTVEQVWTSGMITSSGTTNGIGAGGLVGQVYSGTLTVNKSWSSASIDTSTSGTATILMQGGIIGGDELNYGQASSSPGGGVKLTEVNATGTMKWASTAHRGIGGLFGLHYQNSTAVSITDSFSWATFISTDTSNFGGIYGVAAGSASTATRTYQATASTCVSSGSLSFTANPTCNTKETPGTIVSGVSGSAWTTTGGTVLTNLPYPTKPIYVQPVTPTDGSFSSMTFNLLDATGLPISTTDYGITLSGTAKYSISAATGNGTYYVDYAGGLTLGGTNGAIYTLQPWYNPPSITISAKTSTLTTAPTAVTAVKAGSGTLSLGWTAATTTETTALSGYNVRYSTSDQMTSPTVITVGKVTGTVISGLTNGTTYYIQVRAIGGSTWSSAYSTVTSATPDATATTINVVASGGAASSAYTVNGGVISTTGTVSINAADIVTLLGTQSTVQLAADTVNVNSALTWASNSVLKLGNSTSSTVAINANISASGGTSGLNIAPATYALDVKGGDSITLTGATASLSIGGNSYTLIKKQEDFASVTATGSYAIANSITMGNALTASAIPIAGFTGTLDGMGNTVSGMTMNLTSGGGMGLIQSTGAGAAIRNLGVTNTTVNIGTYSGAMGLGGIVGNVNGTTTLDQVWTTGSIKSSAGSTVGDLGVGGLVGNATTGTLTISKSWSSMNIDTASNTFNYLMQGGIIGGAESSYGQLVGTTGGSIVLNQVYSTGSLKWAASTKTWHGVGGIMGIFFNSGTMSMTDVFSWVNMSRATGAYNYNFGGIIGVSQQNSGASTYTRTYTNQTLCTDAGQNAAAKTCTTSVVPGSSVSTMTGGAWTTDATFGTYLTNVVPPNQKLFVQVIAPSDGSYSGMSNQIVDSNGTAVSLSNLNLSTSGTPVYSIAPNVSRGIKNNVTYISGYTLGGISAGAYTLSAWPTGITVNITRLAQASSWTPTTSVEFGSGSFTPSSPTFEVNSIVSYSVANAGSTGCAVDGSTGRITYTSGGTCDVTATGTSTTDFTSSSITVTFTIGNAAAAPTVTAVGASASGIHVSWNAPTVSSSIGALTGYQIVYSKSADMSSPTTINTGNTDTFYYLTAPPNNTYYIQVRAVSGSTWSGALSTVVSAVPKTTATTITVVASGGGTLGTDYFVSNGNIYTTAASASVNVGDIENALQTGNVLIAANNIVVNTSITWSTSQVLTIGTSSGGSLEINDSILSSGASAGIVIRPVSYKLKVSTGAEIILSGASSTLSIGGTNYTLIRSIADLATVTATGNYALSKPLSFSATALTASPINKDFTGTFDGLGNTLNGMNISVPVDSWTGLFMGLSNNSIVRNLGITNAKLTLPSSGSYAIAGVLAGNVPTATTGTVEISNVWTSGFIYGGTATITSIALGGLVGNARAGTLNISQSWSSVNIDSSSISSTNATAGGILGSSVLNFGSTNTAGANVNITEVYSTGYVKTKAATWRGFGGIMGLHFSSATTKITDSFSWGLVSTTDVSNFGGILGSSNSGTSTLLRTYTANSSCLNGTTPTGCVSSQTIGSTVSGMNTSVWAASGASTLVNLATPTRQLYVQVVTTANGTYENVSYQIVDGSGAVQNTAALTALGLSVSGTASYTPTLANAPVSATPYNFAYASGLTLGGSNAGLYTLVGPWRDTTAVTISKYSQTISWAPTTSVSFGSGTFTPDVAPVPTGGTSVTYAVTSAGVTGCTVNATTGTITYTQGGSCTVSATTPSTGNYLQVSTSVTFVIAEPATAPVVTVVKTGTGALSVGWAAPTVNSSVALTGYTVQYSTSAAMTSPTTVNVGNTRGLLVTGLTNGTTYYFQVRAVSGTAWYGQYGSVVSAAPAATATTINVVTSGGGVAGTDYTVNGGVISTTGTASINASEINTILASEGTVQLAADTVNVNGALSWSSNAVLVLGNTTASSAVNVNSTITGSGASAGVKILPATYGLEVKSGAYIRLTGASPSFNLGGTSYTVVNTPAGLTGITTSSVWAVTAPIILSANYATAIKDMSFTGTMDGLGNTINGMQITPVATGNIGFYASLGGAVIRNIGFTNVNISSATGGIDLRLGAIAGNGSGSGTNTVSQVWATGFINQTSSAANTRVEAGGLFGGATAGTLKITKSWSSVAVSTNAGTIGSGGIIGANVSTFGGSSGAGNTLTISESYSTGNILRNLPTVYSWYGNGGIIGVSYGLSTTITNVFSWGNINSSGSQSGTSTAGIVGVGGTSGTSITNAYTTSSTCGGPSITNCLVDQTAGAAVSGGTGFTSGLWQSVNGTSLTNLAIPTKLLYVRVKAPTNGAFETVSYEIVDSTGTVQTLSSLNLSISGTPTYDTLSISSPKATYSVNYSSGLTLGGTSSSVYSLNAWKTATSVTITKLPQTLTWSPTTAVQFKNGTFTPSVLATALGTPTITYAVTGQGVTGCTVNSTTGVVTYLAGGTCTVTASAAEYADYTAATAVVSFVISAAPTITIVQSGGGVSGTDYTISGGILWAGADVSVNASDLVTALASGSVQLAGSVVVNAPITWSGNTVLALGGTSSNTVTINKSISGSGNTAGIVIRPATYALSVKDGASISLSGTTPTLSIGGNSYNLIKSIAELSLVTATAGTYWALAVPLTFTTTKTGAVITVAFAGTFDGLGNTVDKLAINQTTGTSTGFFRNITGGTIRNLGVTNQVVSLEPAATNYSTNAGGLVGESGGGTLEQVWTTGFIKVKAGSTYSGLLMGGLVGNSYGGTLNVNKSWSSMGLNAWGSTYTSAQAAGGLVGADISTWAATSSTASGNVTISQSYFSGDISSPQTTGITGLGGIMGAHLGTGAVSITDSFSWGGIAISTSGGGGQYGGILGTASGSQAYLQTTFTNTNKLVFTGANVNATSNSSWSVAFGATPGFSTNSKFGLGATGFSLVNLATPYRTYYYQVLAPTDGSYKTLSYRIITGAGSPVTMGSFSVTGTPTYSIDSDVAISATPYLVDYTSGLNITYTGTGVDVYRFENYGFPTSVTISKYSQTISLTSTAPSTAAVGTTYTLAGSATSSLAVAYTIDSASSSICTISGLVVTYTALGTCTINANQAGNTSYNAAPQVQQSTTIDTKGTQSVSFNSTAPSAKVAGATYTPTISATSGLTPALTVESSSALVCSITSGVVSFTAVGDCVLNLNQAGTANWNAATQVQQTINVGKGVSTVSITSTLPTNAVVGGANYTVTSTKTAANTNSVVYSIDQSTSTICSISGASVSFLLAGTCKVNANLDSDDQYAAAAQQQQTITVGKGSQTLSFTSTPTSLKFGSSTYLVTATGGASTSGLTISVDATTSTQCSVSGMAVTYLAVGACTLNLNQAGDDNYNAATQVQQTFTIAKGDQSVAITNDPGTSKVNTTYTPTATSTSTGAVTFTIDAGSSSVCSISGGVVSFNAVGSCVILGDSAASANWNAATQGSLTVTVTKGDQTITFGTTAPTNAVVDGSAYSVSATVTSGASVTLSIDSASSAICSITGGIVSFHAVGTCTVLANSAVSTNWNGAPQVSQDITVGKGSQVLTLTSTDPVDAVVDGTAYTPTFNFGASTKPVVVSIASGSASVCAATNGTISFKNIGDCVYLVNQAGDDNYLPAVQISNTIAVDKGTQTIAWSTNKPANAVVGGATYRPAADGGATGHPVTFRIDINSSSVCNISAGEVHFVGVGSCTVTANQVGDTNYHAAAQETQTFSVGKGSQTVTITSAAPTAVVNGATYTPVATGGASNNAVVFTIASASSAICTLNFGKISFQSVGDCVLEANQAGNTNYNAALQATQTITVGKGAQAISVTSAAPSSKVAGATYTPVASGGSSGEAVTLTVAPTSTAICSVTSGTVSFQGVGSCVIEFNQAGTANWNAAPQVTQTITVAKGTQVLAYTSTPPSRVQVAGTHYIPAVTYGVSGEPVVFSIDPAAANLCTISNGTVSFQAVGDCIVHADQAGNSNFNAATRVTQIFDITKGEQQVAITSSAPAAVVDGDTYTPDGTKGAGTKALVFSVTAASVDICSAIDGSIHFIGAGDCVIEATQAGDANYNAATPKQQTIVVGKGTQTLAFTGNNTTATVDGTAYTPELTQGASSNPVHLSVTSASALICEVVSGKVEFHAVGDCEIVANQAADGNYLAAAAVSQVVSVAKGTQAQLVGSSSIATLVLGATTPTAVLSTTGGSGTGAITWTVSPSTANFCSVTGEIVSGLASGFCDLVATKAGDDNYLEVVSAVLSVAVSTGGQTPIRASVSNPTPTYAPDLTLELSIVGGSGTGAVWYESSTPHVCNTDGSATLNVYHAGICDIVAHKDGDETFESVLDDLSFEIAKANQSSPTLALTESLTYNPNGSASSQLNLTDTVSTGAATFSITEGSCTVSGLDLVATEAGDCEVTVEIAGDENYLSGTFTQVFTVAKADQSPLSAELANNAPAAIAWSGVNTTTFDIFGGSGSGALTATSTTPGICSVAITTDVVTVIGLSQGTCSVDVEKATDGNFVSAGTQFTIEVLDLAAAPTAVRASTPVAGTLTTNLTWTPPVATSSRADFTGFRVQSKIATGDWADVANGSVDADTTSLSVTVTPWTKMSFRVAATTDLDGETLNWANFDVNSDGIADLLAIGGGSIDASTAKVMNGSTDLVYITGVGFDAVYTNKVQITYSGTKGIFTAGLTAAAAAAAPLVKTKLVPATVISPTRLSFAMPKITWPTGVTAIVTQVSVLAPTDGATSEQTPIEYIKVKLAQTLTVTPAFATKTLTVGTPEITSNTITWTDPENPPVITATPANVCTAQLNLLNKLQVNPLAPGKCSITLSLPATPAYNAGVSKSVSYTVMANRTVGFGLTAQEVNTNGTTGEAKTFTTNAPGNLNVAIGADPLLIPVTLSAREGTVVFTSSDDALCTVDAGEAPGLTGWITVLDTGTCTITVTQPLDARYYAGETVTIIVNAVEQAENAVPQAPDNGDATLADPADRDVTDTQPAVEFTLNPAAPATYNFGAEDGIGVDPKSGKVTVKTKSAYVGTWTATFKSPAGKKYFSVTTIVKKKKKVADAANCTVTLTVKKDAKIKKKVSRVVGTCQLNKAGIAALKTVGIQKIKVKYNRTLQYAASGLDFKGTPTTKKRILKKVSRTVVIKIGKPAA